MAEAAIISPAFGSDLLPREISELIFEDAREASVVQQAARRIPLTGAGKAIPYISGTPQASWVGEGGRKPVSDATVGTLTMDPKKLAVIVPFSEEYLSTDNVDLFDELRPAIAESFGQAFDAAALHGTSTPFSAYLAETTNLQVLGAGASTYVDLVNAMGTVVGDGYRVNGWAYSDLAEIRLLGDVDGDGRPILTTVGDASFANRLVGRPAFRGESVDHLNTTPTPDDRTLIFGGDWTKAAWGAVGEIEYDISNQATLTLTDSSTLNLWQDNLVALRAEAHYGFSVRDVEAFVRVREDQAE